MGNIIIKDRELPPNCYMCGIRGQGYLQKYHCPIIRKDFNDEYLKKSGGDKHRLCEDIMFSADGDLIDRSLALKAVEKSLANKPTLNMFVSFGIKSVPSAVPEAENHEDI